MVICLPSIGFVKVTLKLEMHQHRASLALFTDTNSERKMSFSKIPRSLFLIFGEMIYLFPLCIRQAFLSPIIVAFIRHDVDGIVEGSFRMKTMFSNLLSSGRMGLIRIALLKNANAEQQLLIVPKKNILPTQAPSLDFS